MKRPKQEWCEPHLEYIRKLETYIDYLESMTTENGSSENRSHEWKTIEQDTENPILGMLPNLEANHHETGGDDSISRKIRKCHFTDKECYESAFKRLCCEMYQTMSKDSFDPKYAHDCYLVTVGVKQ